MPAQAIIVIPLSTCRRGSKFVNGLAAEFEYLPLTIMQRSLILRLLDNTFEGRGFSVSSFRGASRRLQARSKSCERRIYPIQI
jgi:hypothetical protein